MSSTKDQLYGNSTCTKCIVVKRNTCTEDTCNNTQRVSTAISGLYKHAQQQFNKWNRPNACACHNVCECVYHHYQTGLLYATYMYNHLVCASVHV